MIELYTWPTPNGQKVQILLEECGLPYSVHPIDIQNGDQFKPEFLAISPNNKMPALVDTEGPGGRYSLFESGAILWYLAEKTGQFMSKDPAKRYDTLQWIMFQMASVGPMLGQLGHFRHYAPEKIEYALNRYSNEAKRLYGVVDRRLTGRDYVVDQYSIADMAIYPWFAGHERQGIAIDGFPNVKAWTERLKARPAVQKGMALLTEKRRTGPMDDKAKQNLFGAAQYVRR